MISLGSHSNWGAAYGTSATRRGEQQLCRTRGHPSDVTALTEALYLQDGQDCERALRKGLIESAVLPATRRPEEAEHPVRPSCTSLPRILAGSSPNFLCQDSNGTD